MRKENMLAFTPFNIFLEAGASSYGEYEDPSSAAAALFFRNLNKNHKT
jgi:hypothetical protein